MAVATANAAQSAANSGTKAAAGRGATATRADGRRGARM